MPHAPRLRRYFGHRWRTVTRPRILARAIASYRAEAIGQPWLGGLLPSDVPCEWCHAWTPRREIEIAHLYLPPGVPGHDADQNLAALCGACHHRHDYSTWALECYLTRSQKKDAARPILAAGALEAQ